MKNSLGICLSVLLFANATVSAQQAPDRIRPTDQGHVALQPSPSSESDFQITKTDEANPKTVTQKTASSMPSREWTSIEILLSISVLSFGLCVLLMQTFLVTRVPSGWTPAAILRSYGLTLILTFAVLLITAGYSNQQILPVIGLLGTVAGYLLGANDRCPKTE